MRRVDERLRQARREQRQCGLTQALGIQGNRMNKDIKELTDQLNGLAASQAVLQNLAMALFDATENKALVISQFADITAKSQVHALYPTMPQVFFDVFEEQREALLLLLRMLKRREFIAQHPAGSDRPPANACGFPRRWRGGGTAAALGD